MPRSKAETRYLDTLVEAIGKMEVVREAVLSVLEGTGSDRLSCDAALEGMATILSEARLSVGGVVVAFDEGLLRHVPEGMEVRRAEYLERIERALDRPKGEGPAPVPGEGPDLEALEDAVQEELRRYAVGLPAASGGAVLVLRCSAASWAVEETFRRFVGPREEAVQP